jgi:hypothetical protein
MAQVVEFLPRCKFKSQYWGKKIKKQGNGSVHGENSFEPQLIPAETCWQPQLQAQHQ